jgi:cytochrome c oxidase assembly factor CtaG
MLEHQILTLLSAPLLALARPLPTMLRGLPRGFRRPPAWLRTSAEQASRPVPATFAHGAALWIWHAPGPFEAALGNDLVHGLEHASFLLTGIAFWWAMLASRRRGAAALSIALLFATAAHTAALSALITFAPTVWYGSYGDLADQQLSGVLMWALGGLAYPAAALARLFGLIRRSDTQADGWLGAA